jgi:hypothetical protein
MDRVCPVCILLHFPEHWNSVTRCPPRNRARGYLTYVCPEHRNLVTASTRERRKTWFARGRGKPARQRAEAEVEIVRANFAALATLRDSAAAVTPGSKHEQNASNGRARALAHGVLLGMGSF